MQSHYLIFVHQEFAQIVRDYMIEQQLTLKKKQKGLVSEATGTTSSFSPNGATDKVLPKEGMNNGEKHGEEQDEGTLKFISRHDIVNDQFKDERQYLASGILLPIFFR